MILSYRYNYIFIKTKKTASTAIELNLAPSCGPDDVITEVGTKEELLRGNGVPLCRNFATPEIEAAVRARLLLPPEQRRKTPRLEAKRLRSNYWNHMDAAAVKARVSESFWNSAFKFTIERHPYEKVISMAYFKYSPDGGVPFEEHLDTVVTQGRYVGYPLYSIDGEVVVDEIIRTETLMSDLKRLGDKLGFPVPDKLLSAKSSQRSDRRPAREILSEKQRETVYEMCKKEFELLGYER